STVITGPLDLFTTSRSGESLAPILGAVASFAACWARASGVHALPVITAAAPMTALRMRKDRRSRPEGIADSADFVWDRSSFFSGLVVFIFSCSWMELLIAVFVF